MVTHHGVLSQFRGATPFIMRASLIAGAVQGAQMLKEGDSTTRNMITMGAATLAYTLVYPLEIAGLRMCAELERFRFYKSTRDTFSHIRKNEGIRTVFRGLPYAYLLFMGQLYVTLNANHHIRDLLPSSFGQWQQGLTILGSYLIGEAVIYPFLTLKYP